MNKIRRISASSRELKIQACNSILQARILGINAMQWHVYILYTQLWIYRAICDAHERARTRNVAVAVVHCIWSVRTVHTHDISVMMHALVFAILSAAKVYQRTRMCGKLNGKRFCGRTHGQFEYDGVYFT